MRTTCKKVLIYINISYDGWVIKTLSSCGHFIQCSIVHIFDNHILFVDLHHDADMTIRRRKSWSVIHDNSSRFWSISSWYTLLTSVFEPIFCITVPSNIFIFSYKTCTISPSKTTTSIWHLEIQRIITV